MEKKWWLVIAGCITHAVNTGFSYFGMSVFFPSFEREFGWSRLRRHRSSDPQFTLGEALRHRSFWFLSVAVALRHMVTEGVSVHFVILLVDRGWSTETASGLLGLSALIGARASPWAGWATCLINGD